MLGTPALELHLISFEASLIFVKKIKCMFKCAKKGLLNNFNM